MDRRPGVDNDLGRSGAGARRPGFEKLLAAICEGRVGAVLSLEASRLARNGRDWHTLLEFCGLVGTLIHTALTDRSQKPLETGPPRAGARSAKVIVDHLNVRPP